MNGNAQCKGRGIPYTKVPCGKGRNRELLGEGNSVGTGILPVLQIQGNAAFRARLSHHLYPNSVCVRTYEQAKTFSAPVTE
jgi:hypothetical protein